MVYIESIHLQGGTGHEHIAEVKWRNPSDGNADRSSVATMVDWIDNKGGTAKVRGGNTESTVGTVANGTKPKYLRTHADGTWNDNLLALPKY